jgi:hypothetical protein
MRAAYPNRGEGVDERRGRKRGQGWKGGKRRLQCLNRLRWLLRSYSIHRPKR